MGYIQRKEIIEKIERIRGSKVVTYVISTRPSIRTMIEHQDVRIIFNHLKKTSKLDLIIYSNGGVSTVAWPLVSLIKEFTNNFSVLVPFNAFSCATSIALGADEIIMGKMGTLGPIDPTVANQFNPIINNQLVGISVEDVAGFLDLIKEKFKIKRTKFVSKHFEQLAADIKPLALGNAYRHYIKAREDARKILELHMGNGEEKKKEKIISTLTEKLYFHGHNINRVEATEIGLPIKKAEEIINEDENLDSLLWDLYKDYEAELQLNIPYKDELPTTGDVVELPIKYIESLDRSDVFIIEQNWERLSFPAGCFIIRNNNIFSVYNPSSREIIPVLFKGVPTNMQGAMYDKQEISYWKI